MTPREKKARAAELHRAAQAIYEKYRAEGAPPMPDAEASEYDRLLDERDRLTREAAVDEAREKRMNDFDAATRGQTQSGGGNPLPHNDPTNASHPYSLIKAIRQMGSKGAEPLDGIEAETSQEIAKRTNRVPQGFYMPHDLAVRRGFTLGMRKDFNSPEHRDLTLTTGAGAKPTITEMGTWIELLRNATLTDLLGVTIMSDMTGDFAIPRKTASTAAYWVTEGNAPTESNPTVGQVLFQPSTVGAFSDISRKFIIQSSMDAEMFLRMDLAQTIAIEIDRVTFNGSGSGAEPEGIVPKAGTNVTAIGTNGGALTWAHVLSMESDLAIQNAPSGNVAWVSPPRVRGNMKALMKATNTWSPVWDRNEVEGYPAYASNQIPSALSKGTASGTLSAAILGVWSLAVWAFWTGVDVLVDPYTQGTSGTVRVTMLQDCDFQVRQEKAFSVCKDILPT